MLPPLSPAQLGALRRVGITTHDLNLKGNTMNERIDHAAEALGWRELVNDQYESGCPDHEKVVEYGTIMQAHATLALVEQTRIANLIALGTAETGPYRYLDAGRTELRSEDAFGAAAHLLGIEEVQA